MKTTRKRPSGITTLSIFELMGAIGCLGLLPLTPAGSRDFIALVIGGLFGLLLSMGYGRFNPGLSGSQLYMNQQKLPTSFFC